MVTLAVNGTSGILAGMIAGALVGIVRVRNTTRGGGMRTDLVIVALVVGLGTWLFRFLPTRLRASRICGTRA